MSSDETRSDSDKMAGATARQMTPDEERILQAFPDLRIGEKIPAHYFAADDSSSEEETPLCLLLRYPDKTVRDAIAMACSTTDGQTEDQMKSACEAATANTSVESGGLKAGSSEGGNVQAKNASKKNTKAKKAALKKAGREEGRQTETDRSRYSDFDMLKDEMQAMKLQLEGTKDEMQAMKLQLEGSLKKTQRLETESHEMRAEIKRLTAKVEKQDTRIVTQNNLIARLKSDNKDLKEKVDDLEKTRDIGRFVTMFADAYRTKKIFEKDPLLIESLTPYELKRYKTVKYQLEKKEGCADWEKLLEDRHEGTHFKFDESDRKEMKRLLENTKAMTEIKTKYNLTKTSGEGLIKELYDLVEKERKTVSR